MIDVTHAVTALAVGALLGVVFFGGLWLTVRNGIAARHPAVWFLLSLWLRVSIVLAGFYGIRGMGWPALLGCLLGFLGARTFATRMTRANPQVGHAS